jgi:hypothetical protein
MKMRGLLGKVARVVRLGGIVGDTSVVGMGF